ncbi:MULTISPECIES: ATP-binding cassette domain-containing protein [Peptoniphilus]|uniref:ATP-binding cassette domain-containing protein n=1 Tax=Peptoniphilus TaxID=162289 RepID=UPI0002D84DF0|nr:MULTISPECIES: ATP-binding cassette domain-containing protein [Peptoniphilus]
MKLEVENLTKYFDDKLIFKNVTFSVKDSERLAIIGKSGSGKTTLIKIIMGLTNSNSGKIIFDTPPEFSVVFQENLLFEERTVYENLIFCCEIDKTTALKLLSELELEDYINTKVKALSGGMKRRIAILRAIVKRGNIFIFDEAIREVDGYTANLIISFLNKRLKNAPLIYITHDESEIEKLNFDKIIKL